mmetsp:Transcript_15053/g.32647  ORF Transcript_15053/g.32647 Transcript_15053/m.32647 type:complete len:87 (+) Transcript_15053:2848-3108(+)
MNSRSCSAVSTRHLFPQILRTPCDRRAPPMMWGPHKHAIIGYILATGSSSEAARFEGTHTGDVSFPILLLGTTADDHKDALVVPVE